MQKQPFARDVVRDVTAGLRRAVAVARRAGVPKSQIVLDPGIGFGKSWPQNFELLARLPELAKLGFPLLVGTSRKSFIGKILGGAGERRARLGHGRHRRRKHSRRRAHRSRPRRRRNGAGRASRRRGDQSGAEAGGPSLEMSAQHGGANPKRRSRQFPQRADRRFSRLDARRLRLLHPHVRPLAGRRGFSQVDRRRHADADRKPGDAPGRRISFRLAGGPLRAAAAADARRPVLLGHRDLVRLRADLSHILHLAAALRHRHGRRMGRGRVARDGVGAGEVARNSFRRFAGGLRARQSAGGHRFLDGFPALGLARRCFSSAACRRCSRFSFARR